ncbi:non-muscle cofilin 1-like [Labrus bergylta]|uniref:Cofilin-2-like n=1 Tax=Labrus bergylta TaxID=56723 RepID=A0A3Q3EB54_9LABR|nr:cofilin-2-like [Labrus bergylta]
MASGMTVTDKVKTQFDKMKVNKAADDSDKRMRLVTCTIQDDVIDVKNIYTQEMLGKGDLPEDAYQLLVSLMVEDKCFYALYDCHLETSEGIKKEELVFVTWIPDDIAIKHRMVYASSKENVKNACKGFKHEVSVNDKSKVVTREAFAECLEKLTPAVVSLEGVRLSGKK